jgi:cyanophycin synthetase
LQRFRIALSAPETVNLTNVDDWLRTILEADFDPGAYTGHREALTWRLLLLVRALLQASYLPVFAAGRVVRIEADSQNPAGWLAMIEIPRIDNLPERCYTLAIQAASKAMAEITAQPPSPQGLASLYANLEKDAVKPLRRLIGAGKSTVPVLRAAWQMDIPFTHFGGGIYQLGWGCNARCMDRSSTGEDPVIAAKLAQNKVWSANLLHAAGLPAPVHGVAANAEEALQLALRLGWPVVVKPVDGDRGEGVSVGISDEASLHAALKIAQRASRGRPVIVEREVRGVCHRLFVANGQLLYAVKRWPKSVLGDGMQTVAALIEAANHFESSRPPWVRSEPYPADAAAVEAMGAAGFTPESIPAAGQPVPLRRIESTAAGGLDEDVSTRIHPDNLDIALRATALFGLQVAGVDIISPDIGQSWQANGAIINEVNYAPLFGGGEISRRHIPLFFERFIPGDGRIPIEVFVGGEAAFAAARERQREQCGEGAACFLTSHEATLTPNGDPLHLSFASLHQRCRALLMDPRVAMLVLVIQTDELLYAGLPADRIRQLTAVDDAVSPRGAPGRSLPPSRLEALLTQLQELAA